MPNIAKVLGIGVLVLSTNLHAQRSNRATPGAPTSNNSSDDFAPLSSQSQSGLDASAATSSATAQAAKSSSSTAAPKADIIPPRARVGDYVELDESIRAEMYGTVDFPNAELKDIVKAISKLANKNFILSKNLENKKVTIISPEPVTKQEAYNAFLSALYMNGLTIVSMGKFLKIVEAKDALQTNIRVFAGDYIPASEEVVTALYTLKFLDAEDIQRFLVDLVPRSARVTRYPGTNTLVMTDTGLNLRRVTSILKSIDVPGHEDQLESIPIRYASAKGIAGLIDDILEAQTGRSRPGSPTRGPQKTRGGGVISKIVPDERTNALVILANGRGLKELKDLVAKLDTPNASGGNIHIYYCKNAVAEELANTINALVSGTQKPSTPGSAPVGLNNSPTNLVAPLGPVSSRSSSSDGIRLEGNIKVTADKATNSLVIVGSSADYAALRNVLKKLDIPRRQIYVEATIMEISTGNNFQFGLVANVASPGVPQSAGFLPQNAGIDATKLVGPPSITGVVAGLNAGRVYDYTAAGQAYKLSTVTALIRALQETSQGQILHQPQILTSDNQEALITVKDIVPTVTQETTQSNPPVIANKIDKQPVEITLRITPQVGENSDLVKLKVEESIDDFQNAQVAGQIQVTQRKANTTVVVRDGDSVVIGGLQKTSSRDSRSKIPLLGDLPILGNLFKYSNSQEQRSDLLLFLTPHLINEYSDLINITQKKLESREKLGKTLFDPKDKQRERISEMKAKNAEDAKKAPPRSWGFRNKVKDEDDIDTTEVNKIDADDDKNAPNPYSLSTTPSQSITITPPALKGDLLETPPAEAR